MLYIFSCLTASTFCFIISCMLADSMEHLGDEDVLILEKIKLGALLIACIQGDNIRCSNLEMFG